MPRRMQCSQPLRCGASGIRVSLRSPRGDALSRKFPTLSDLHWTPRAAKKPISICRKGLKLVAQRIAKARMQNPNRADQQFGASEHTVYTNNMSFDQTLNQYVARHVDSSQPIKLIFVTSLASIRMLPPIQTVEDIQISTAAFPEDG
jgi:hypothetical protein